jgi:hypothetical protein
MQARHLLHPYRAALIIAAIITSFAASFAMSRPAAAQIDPAATGEATAQTLLLPAQQDATVAQLFPNQNFGDQQNLVAARQLVGAEFVAGSDVLLRWDLSNLPPGATIEDAAFGLFQTDASANAGAVLVEQVLSSWNSGTVTWANQPSSAIYDRTWSPPTTAGEYVFYSGDATNNTTARNLVQEWVDAPGTNFGVLLSYGGANLGGRVFSSLEATDNNPPLLRIRYTLPRIRVCLDTIEPCSPAGGASVYDATSGQVLPAGLGGLIDAGAVALGAELWARLQVKDPYPQARLFYTTADVTPVTVAQFEQYPSTDLPELRLLVQSDKPLLLYDLNMTAQWYLNDDPEFTALLRRNVIRASDYLYDFTEGQFALGTVTVRQMYEGWDAADIKLQTSNVLHPNATIGGIVISDTVDISPAIPITYTAGSIFMGSYWNRFGEPPNQVVRTNGVVVTEAEMADDWSIALAHEMGHYLLFLFDTYTDKNGVSSDTIAAQCVGSAMGNAYLPRNQAFVFDQAAWDADCGATEAHFRLAGRSEWETIGGWYNFAVTPSAIRFGVYPPVPLTNVVFVDPATTPGPLANQVYTLTYQLNQASSGEARAFLIRDDSLIFEQGQPPKGTTNVELTDARVGDRLCVYDLNDHAEAPDTPRYQFGCETVTAGDSQMVMTHNADWRPVITIKQTGLQQLSVTIKQALAGGLVLEARLIPETDAAGPVQVLARNGDTWSTVFDLAGPVEPVYLQVWVKESVASPQTPREAMADRGTGGNGAYGPARHFGGVLTVSSDGNASYVSDEPIELLPGESVAWQSMPGTPPVPPWKRVSGQSYRLDAFPAALVNQGTVSIEFEDTFGVMQASAPAAPQAVGARVHFWDGAQWQPLATTVGTPTGAEDGVQVASARSQGIGVYAVMVDSRPNMFMPVVKR